MMQLGNRVLYPPSLAHTVGNVTFKMVHELKEMFGPKFFKFVHIDTRMAFTDFGENTNREFIKRKRPILSVKPVVDITNQDIFLTHTLFTTNMYPNMSFDKLAGGNFNYLPFFRDLKVRNAINYLMNRIRISFGVYIDVDTVIEQMNIFQMLTTMFQEERPYWQRTAIEIQIPRPLMRMVSVDSAKPMYDDNDSVKEFLSYMNMNSCKPVTYQMKNSTGHDEFFLYYPLTIEKVYTDFSMESPNKNGFAQYSAPITFTLTTEFNTIQLFEYTPPRGKPFSIDAYDLSIEDKKYDFKQGSVMIPIFSFENMFTDTDEHGWKYFTSNMYKIENTEGLVEDELDLAPIFQNTILNELIAYHNQHGIDNHIFFHIKVMMIDIELKENKEFIFDFNRLVLITRKLNKHATYRFIIYVNNEYINDLMVKLHPEQFIY